MAVDDQELIDECSHMLSTSLREGPTKTVESILTEGMELSREVLGDRHTIVEAPFKV